MSSAILRDIVSFGFLGVGVGSDRVESDASTSS